jgi:hypothetical protein
MFLNRRVRRKDGKEHVRCALCESPGAHAGRAPQRQVLHPGGLKTTQTANRQRTLEIVNKEVSSQGNRLSKDPGTARGPSEAGARLQAPALHGTRWGGAKERE